MLSGKQRQVIQMHFEEEMRFAEIAEVMGCTKSAVCKPYHRAIARLRKHFNVPDKRGGVLQSERTPMISPKLHEKMSTFTGCASNIYLLWKEEVGKMTKTLHRVLLFTGLLAASMGLWLVAQQGGQPNLITQEQAREQALRFLAVCELPTPQNAPMVRLKEPAGLPVWQLQWPNLYTVGANARTGAVIWFKNYAREYEQVKGINRNRLSRFTSRQEMEQYMW